MLDAATAFELQDLVARFANSFDLKEWDRLAECLTANVHTDYSDLRGTPPETMSREEFVGQRRSALHDLQTHHLAGNLEMALSGDTTSLKVSMMIHRRNDAGETLTTHCLYFFGVEQEQGVWRIGSIRQKVLMSYGESAIHKGIAKR